MSSPLRAGRRPLAARFLIYFAVAYTLLIGLMAFVIMRSVEATLVDDLTAHLEQEARLVAASMPDDPEDLGRWASEMFAIGGFRVTIIDTDGVVVADSHSDPAVMENHGTRPEVVAAMSQGVPGHSVRVSASTGFEQHYVALPPEDGMIVRLSVAQRAISDEFDPIRTTVITTTIIVGLIGVAVVAYLARRLSRPITLLTDQTMALARGDTETRPRRSSVRELDQLGLAITSLVDDLGERARLAESASETLEIVLGALPQGTILVDHNDSIVYANPSAYQLLGAVPNELDGLFPLSFQNAVRESRETRSPVTTVVEHGKPARKLRGVASPFTDDRRVLLIVVDVTERDRVDRIRRDFVANASHELKTPVSSIIASSEALRIAVTRDPESAIRFAAQIEGSTRQLDRMVSDLLDLSRIERETPELDPVRLDLLVREEVERVRPLAEERGIKLTVESDPTDVNGSRRDLASAVRNVLDNAVRYTPEGGKIDVSLATHDGDAVVSVADSGIGIPTRDLERVFERFYRVDAARSRASGGTGLGLAIVKHVMQGHGGAVSVESELGVGSTFRLRLPLLQGGSALSSN